MSPRLKNILVVAAIFIAGVVTGSVNSIGFGQRLVESRLRIDNLKTAILEILSAELELTAEQAAKIDPLVEEACDQYRALTLETLDRVAALVDAANDRIARELTPQQAERLRALEAQRREQVRRRLDQDYLKKDFLVE